TRRRGGGHDTSHLPSNTERWGRAFGEQQQPGHDEGGSTSVCVARRRRRQHQHQQQRGIFSPMYTVNPRVLSSIPGGTKSSSSKVGFQETERLLDESEWATGASSWRIGAAGEQEGDQIDSEASASAAAGELLSLNLGVLEVCLQRLQVHERLRLPPAYTAQLEAERQREDPALEPATSDAVLTPGNGVGAEDAENAATKGRGASATVPTTAAASAAGAAGVGDDGGDDAVLDALLGLPSAVVPSDDRGGTGVAGDGGRKVGLSPPQPASRDRPTPTATTRTAVGPSTVTTTRTPPAAATQGQERARGGQMANVPGSPTDVVVEGVRRTWQSAADVGGGGGGAEDYLEDWLDGMLAES
ncbi:unnamed protein product, partial [Hapterophycus canaliculatus]